MIPPSSPSTPWSGNFSWMNCMNRPVIVRSSPCAVSIASMRKLQHMKNNPWQKQYLTYPKHNLLAFLVSISHKISCALVSDLARLVCSLSDDLQPPFSIHIVGMHDYVSTQYCLQPAPRMHAVSSMLMLASFCLSDLLSASAGLLCDIHEVLEIARASRSVDTNG